MKRLPGIFILFFIWLSGFSQRGTNSQPLLMLTKNVVLPKAASTRGGIPLSGIQLTVGTGASTCDGYNGHIIIIASGGTAPYSYKLDGGLWSNTPFFFTNSLTPHTVYVKDATGQMVSQPVTVPNFYDPPHLQVSKYVNPSGCTTQDASVTVQATGGAAPYTYSMDLVNWSASPTFSGLPAGLYYFYVKDANGCTGTVQFTTNSCLGYGSGNSNANCGQGGAIHMTAYPYTNNPPVTYSLDGINYQNTGDFTGLTPGLYVVRIKDGAGAVGLVGWNITNACYLTMQGTSQETSCGNSDGVITVTATNGTPPYLYSVDAFHYQSGNIFTGLPAGNYTVLVQDFYGQMAGTAVTIGSNCPQVTATSTDAHCGNSDGSITAAGASGTAPYTYSLDGVHFQTSPTFTGLPPGLNTVTVMDASLFTATTTVTVKNNCLQVTGTPQNSTCDKKNGQITAAGTGGAIPYTYSLDGTNFQSNTLFTGLAAGDYTLTVKDASGQTNSTLVTVGNTPGPSISWTSHPTDCDNNGGLLTINATGGTPPYLYSYMAGQPVWTSYNYFGLPSGPYVIAVMDANGCITTDFAHVYWLCLILSATGTDAGCANSDGRIVATASNGTAPYVYSLDGVNFQSNPIFSGLAPATYTVTAKDATGLTNTTIVKIENGCLSVALSATDAACNQQNGKIGVTASGGVLPYQYSLDGTTFQDGALFSPVAPGNYTVTVRDSHGNTATGTTVVANLPGPTADAGPDLTICEGKGVVIPANSNATNFSWQPSTGLNDPSLLQPTASPSVTTLYSLTATDGACRQTTSVNVIVNPAPIANAGESVTICYGMSALLQGSGGSDFVWTPDTYLSNPASADPTVNKPSATMTWSLTVTDGKGCQSLNRASVTVTVTPPPQLFAGADTSVLAGQPVPLYAQDINNSGFTQFTWSPAEGLNDPTIQGPVAILQEGIRTYTVMAATDGGCSAVGNITIKTFGASDIFVPTAFSPNGDGHNDILKALPVGIRDFKYFAVFSRWGQRLFYTSDFKTGWDGSVNGRLEGSGTYIWMTGGVDYKGQWIERRGTVVLVR